MEPPDRWLQGRKIVVVVEMNEDVRELLRTALGICGAETRVFTDPRQAIESLQHDPADAIITEQEHRDTVARLARGAVRAAVADERVDLPPPRVSGYDVVVSPANPLGSCRRIAEVLARESLPPSP
jgi:CheY-like chemotaxis protein